MKKCHLLLHLVHHRGCHTHSFSCSAVSQGVSLAIIGQGKCMMEIIQTQYLNVSKTYLHLEIFVFPAAPPSAPMCPKISPQSPVSLGLFWVAPSDTHCIANYIITLTNITEGNASFMYETASNSTSLAISGVTEGAAYFFTVARVDT